MSNKIQVNIKSRTEELYDGLADIVILRTFNGDIGIMANHINFLCVISKNKVKIKNQSRELIFDVFDGIASVFDNKINIISFD